MICTETEPTQDLPPTPRLAEPTTLLSFVTRRAQLSSPKTVGLVVNREVLFDYLPLRSQSLRH